MTPRRVTVALIVLAVGGLASPGSPRLADQTVNALWLGDADDKQRQKQSVAACAAPIGARRVTIPVRSFVKPSAPYANAAPVNSNGRCRR